MDYQGVCMKFWLFKVELTFKELAPFFYSVPFGKDFDYVVFHVWKTEWFRLEKSPIDLFQVDVKQA